MKHLCLVIITFSLINNVYSQLTYQGVTKITLQQSSKSINGTWNSFDHTGNAAMDKTLNKIALMYKNQTRAIRALETSSAQIKSSPQKFINPDGSINQKALTDLLVEKFASVAAVTIPADSIIEQESSQY